MVPLISLWLPILLSAVVVFMASSAIHMVLRYHARDFRKLPEEDAIRETLRRLNVAPGDYVFPCAGGPEEMKTPAFRERWSAGPVGFMTVIPSGPPAMGKNLAQWFVYCVVVEIFAAYIAGRALPRGAPYLSVFRFAGATALVGYALALWQNTIWYRRAWTTTAKTTFDGLVYALLSAGIFGWLWPK